MKKHIAKLLAACMMCTLISNTWIAESAQAETGTSALPYGAGTVSDGVSFSSLKDGYVYFGQAKHPLELGGRTNAYYGEVSKWEENATPVLWQVMGEEVDENDQGDGKITLMSKYIMQSELFQDATSESGNDYTESLVSRWLNDPFDGFLNGTFTSAEDAAIEVTDVTTANYTCDGNNTELTEDQGKTWPRTISQKIYLPWGTFNGSSGALQYPSTDAKPTTVYWSANPVQGKNEIAKTMQAQAAFLKDGNIAMRYWLRSPKSGGTTDALAVNNASGRTYVYNHRLGGDEIGYRPVMKIDPESIVFAAEVKNEPQGTMETGEVAPHLIEAEAGSSNYKLTILGEIDGNNPYSLELKDQVSGNEISAIKGEDIILTAQNPSNSGAGYSINYKLVIQAGTSRKIVAAGSVDTVNPAGEETSVVIPTTTLPRSSAEYDVLDLYVWLQKNNQMTSNEASEPIHLSVKLTGGEISALPEEDMEPLDDDTADDIIITYPEGKMKAAICF